MSAMQITSSQPTLSILVPVYNTGDLLEPCLQSLAAQSVEGIEFVCIDDGSRDDSGRILDIWAARDARFRVIHQANGGYGKAMNHGLSAARGEWIGIVEPDDWIEPTMYSHLMELARHTQAPVVKGSYTIERHGATRQAGKFCTLTAGTELAPTDVPDYILGSPSIWSAIYRRDWLQEHNIRFSETPGASYQDLGFGIRTWVAAHCVCVTPAGAYHYREDTPPPASASWTKEPGPPCASWNCKPMYSPHSLPMPKQNAAYWYGAFCTPCRPITACASARAFPNTWQPIHPCSTGIFRYPR